VTMSRILCTPWDDHQHRAKAAMKPRRPRAVEGSHADGAGVPDGIDQRTRPARSGRLGSSSATSSHKTRPITFAMAGAKQTAGC
jgi:hypothetical protein